MKYDLHTHTKYSRCGGTSPELLLKSAKRAGLNGIAVTDHNVITGALKVKTLNKDPDFEVIPGCEVSTDIGHVLVYYVEEAPKKRSFQEVLDFAKSAGGLVSISHPFRFPKPFGLKRDIKEISKAVDALECFNSRNFFGFLDKKAENSANQFNIGKTGGSDGHFWFEVGRGYTLFEGNLQEAVKKRKTEVGGIHIVSMAGSFLSLLFKAVKKIKE